MTDRLTTLLNDEAARIDVPVPPLEAIRTRGLKIQRRRRTVRGIAATAAVALVVAGSALIVSRWNDPSLEIAPADAASLAEYRHSGAFADGDVVHIAGHEVTVPGLSKLAYSSMGALVLSTDTATGPDARRALTLVTADGRAIDIDAGVGDLPGTELDSANVAYVHPVDGGSATWELTVRSLQSGKVLAQVPYQDDVTSGSGEPSPVRLDGDRVFLVIEGELKQIDWRTGDITPGPEGAGGLVYESSIGYDRYLVTAPGRQPDENTWAVRSLRDDSLVGKVPAPGRNASLSPTGDHVLVQTSDGTQVYDVSSGSRIDLQLTGKNTFGWTPDGSVIASGSRTGTVQVCDVSTGACEDTGVQVDGTPTFVLGVTG